MNKSLRDKVIAERQRITQLKEVNFAELADATDLGHRASLYDTNLYYMAALNTLTWVLEQRNDKEDGVVPLHDSPPKVTVVKHRRKKAL